MLRASYLIASKLNLPTSNIKTIPYSDLKSVFKPVAVLNEQSLLEKYSATVTYAYEKRKLYNLLLEYGGDEIENQFYEFIILPVFKQGNTLKIWQENKYWIDYWAEFRKVMNAHKIYYPNTSLFYSQKVHSGNLFDLKFEDFISIFHNVLFKNVMIITTEFFTDRKSNDSIMQVKKYIFRLDGNEPEIIEEEYDLNSWNDISITVGFIIDKIIDDYGILRDQEDDGPTEDRFFTEQELKQPIIMNFDVYEPAELEILISKLENVKLIDDFEIKHDSNIKYKIFIYTSADEYELAEALYLNGLSYRVNGNIYNLIDVKTGL
jgi:hypothetical protein